MSKIINGVASEYEFPDIPRYYQYPDYSDKSRKETVDLEKKRVIPNNVKQLIIVRKDLNMPVGKLAAQVAHASLLSFLNGCGKKKSCYQTDYSVFAFSYEEEWLNDAYTKVILEVKNESQLLKYQKIAQQNAIPHALITDMGRTCFDNQDTITCLGIGPFENETLDKLFKRLQLYK